MSDSKALAIINKAAQGGALVFAGQGLSEVAPLYKAEATVIEVQPSDFHDLKGKLVPKKETCDRFGEAAGVSFVAASCGVKTELREDELGRRTVFVGYAQGRTRLPDGSWRESAVEEYEFDPVLRAKMDAGTKSESSLRMDYMRCARQRASTGARLRVIRQLVGMPTAFDKATIEKAAGRLVVSRVVLNTDQILATPEGRRMATAAALGMVPALFGPQQAQPAAAASADPEASEPRDVTPDEDDDWGEAAPPAQASDEVAELQGALADYIAAGTIPAKGVGLIQDALDRGETDVIVLRDLVSRAKAHHDKATARAS